jgi:type IV pilus assembly protein PilC
MSSFSYVALNSSGTEIRGKIQADDIHAAASVVRARGLRILELKPGSLNTGFLGQANFSDWLASQRSASQSSLIFFFRQMSFMLRSGLAAAQALSLAASQISNPRLNLVVRLMYKDIEAGQSLSYTMKKHPQVFTDMVINLTAAGESTGDLDKIMERLATHLEKKAAIRAQTITAMIYPSVVIVAAIGVGSFMTVKIIPKFAQFLLSQGRVLPPSTQALIDFSDYVRNNGLFLLGLLIAFVVTVLALYQTSAGRKTIDSILLRIPVFGHALVTSAMAQLSWGLSMLLRSGITVFDALAISSRLMQNRVFRDQINDASQQILNGKDMASTIKHPQIPILVTQMIAIGENTGTLDTILEELGEYYERLLETTIKRLTAMLEPAMIVVIGGMVGFVYYAFFQALFSLVSGR